MGSKQIHILTGAQLHLLRRTQVDPLYWKLAKLINKYNLKVVWLLYKNWLIVIKNTTLTNVF